MTKREQILDVAETMARQGGYNHFSFREIASDVGIKSASVHYHFPTKSDLATELANRYTLSFMQALGAAASIVEAGNNPIAHYIQLFRQALQVDKKMCLCGLLGAEFDSLPENVKTATQQFFKRNLEWLTQAYLALGHAESEAASSAAKTLSLLEGAMIVSKTLNDDEVFEQAVCSLQ